MYCSSRSPQARAQRRPLSSRRGSQRSIVVTARTVNPDIIQAMELNYIDLCDRAARIADGRDALVDDAGALTYAEVWVRANRIASALVARGFGPSTRFAIFSPNC